VQIFAVPLTSPGAVAASTFARATSCTEMKSRVCPPSPKSVTADPSRCRRAKREITPE